MLQFCWKIYKNADKLARDFKPDIVIASSTYPMDAYAASKIAKKSGGRYVHEVHDMWPVILTELYRMSTKNPFFAVVQHAEDYFCKNADKVVSILPCTKDYFIEHGMRDDKFIYIPNGVALTDWEIPEQLPDEHLMVLSKAHDDGKFIIVFFGSHARQYGPDFLIKALKNLDQSKVFVAFVGDGNYKKELVMLADSLNISKESCIFLPRIGKKAIPSLLKKSDASYIGAIKSRMFSFGTSQNKIFDAMMGGKPIIYAVDAPNDFAKEYSCGVSVAAEDVEALRESIVSLMDMGEKARKELGNNGRNAILKNFTYDILADKFINGITR